MPTEGDLLSEADESLPPAISHEEIVRRFIEAYEVHHAVYEMLPKNFTPEQGILIRPEDPRVRGPAVSKRK